MFAEHSNDGMIEVDFRTVELLEDGFLSLGEIKKDI